MAGREIELLAAHVRELSSVFRIRLSIIPFGSVDVVISADTIVLPLRSPRKSGSSALPVCRGFQNRIVSEGHRCRSISHCAAHRTMYSC